jgi:hypothetical protein
LAFWSDTPKVSFLARIRTGAPGHEPSVAATAQFAAKQSFPLRADGSL